MLRGSGLFRLRHFDFICHSSFGLHHFDSYRTWLGTPSGGRPLRNSVCCRSASFRCCASRDACSGSGPGLEQPKKTRVNTGIKNTKVARFFIEELNIIKPTSAATFQDGKPSSLKRALQNSKLTPSQSFESLIRCQLQIIALEGF